LTAGIGRSGSGGRRVTCEGGFGLDGTKVGFVAAGCSSCSIGHYGHGALARLPAAARRRQLLDSALEVFAARGFHGASMNDVAEAAGVTKPVLYQHFDSKRQLFIELLEDVGSRLGQLIAQATMSVEGPREKVELGFAAYFRWIDTNRAAFSLLFGGGVRLDPEFADAVHQVESFLAEAIATLLQADIDDEHRRTLAHGIVGLAEGTGRHWIADELDLDPDVLGRQVADLAYAGLRGVHRI
jgi:AcrR family transcriptional regulator